LYGKKFESSIDTGKSDDKDYTILRCAAHLFMVDARYESIKKLQVGGDFNSKVSGELSELFRGKNRFDLYHANLLVVLTGELECRFFNLDLLFLNDCQLKFKSDFSPFAMIYGQANPVRFHCLQWIKDCTKTQLNFLEELRLAFNEMALEKVWAKDTLSH